MAKRESGNVVVASDWTPIPLLDPGMYDAVIQDAKLETFKGTFRNFGTKTEVPNPKDKEGKWDYDKLVMNIDVHDQQKVVSLPGYSETIGIWHEGDYYSPIDKSTMYGRAAKLLRATGSVDPYGCAEIGRWRPAKQGVAHRDGDSWLCEKQAELQCEDIV